MAPWGSRTEGTLTENVFGLICCLQRKLPAAGSHAEIRQAFICSTPACLEKYVINALKCSFITVWLFLVLFYFDSFCLGTSSAGNKTHPGDVGRGSVLSGGLDGWAHSLPHFFSVEGRVRGVEPVG